MHGPKLKKVENIPHTKFPSDRALKYRLKKYGITERQLFAMYDEQEGLCAICEGSLGRYHIDHDHKTGEIRSLLCLFCNRYVVGRHRNASLLAAAAKYLEGPFTGWFVPIRVKKHKRKRRKG